MAVTVRVTLMFRKGVQVLHRKKLRRIFKHSIIPQKNISIMHLTPK
jgi:hypothetical protein